MGAGAAVSSFQLRVAIVCMELLNLKNELPSIQYECFNSISPHEYSARYFFEAMTNSNYCSQESLFFTSAVFKICCRTNEFNKLRTLSAPQLQKCNIVIDAIRLNISEGNKMAYYKTLMTSNSATMKNITSFSNFCNSVERALRASMESAASSIHESQLETCIKHFNSSFDNLLLYLEEMDYGATIISLNRDQAMPTEYPIVFANRALAASMFANVKCRESRTAILGRNYLYSLQQLSAEAISEKQLSLFSQSIEECRRDRMYLSSFSSSSFDSPSFDDVSDADHVILLEPLLVDGDNSISCQYMIQLFLPISKTARREGYVTDAIEAVIGAFRKMLVQSGFAVVEDNNKLAQSVAQQIIQQ